MDRNTHCGHDPRYIVSLEDGTHYCEACEQEASGMFKFRILLDFEDSNNDECGFQVEHGKLMLQVTEHSMVADGDLACQLAKVFQHFADTGKLPIMENE